MNVLRSRFFQAVVIWAVAFGLLRFGIRPAAPWSVLSLYMFIITLALLVFVSSDRDSWRDFVRPIWLTLTDPRYRLLRTVIVFAIPLLLGYYAYTQAAAKPQAPPELRAVHPAPPSSIQFRGKEITVQGFDNPLRKDQANLRKHVAAAGELPGPGNDRHAAGGVPLLAHCERRTGASEGVDAVELRDARLGRSPH